MQELRFVLIIVGALAIAALLFHGLWTIKKKGKQSLEISRFGKLDNDSLDEAETIPQAVHSLPQKMILDNQKRA